MGPVGECRAARALKKPSPRPLDRCQRQGLPFEGMVPYGDLSEPSSRLTMSSASPRRHSKNDVLTRTRQGERGYPGTWHALHLARKMVAPPTMWPCSEPFVAVDGSKRIVGAPHDHTSGAALVASSSRAGAGAAHGVIQAGTALSTSTRAQQRTTYTHSALGLHECCQHPADKIFVIITPN